MQPSSMDDPALQPTNTMRPWILPSAAPGGPPQGSPLRPARFSTGDVPEEKQFAAWRDECSSVIEMRNALGTGPGFAARYEMWKLGSFALSTAQTPAASYARTRAAIRRDGIDHWVLAIVRRGTFAVRTASGDVVRVPAGVPTIFSLAEVSEAQRSDIDWLCLYFPREMFPDFAPTLDRCCNRPVPSTMGQLLAAYLDDLRGRLPSMTEQDLPRLVEATRAMIAACVTPPPEARLAATVQLDQARMERVRRAIRQNLRSPTLTPNRLCRTVGMSRSQLYRLFEPIGGVARYIQSERLREAYRALGDARDTRDIHRIGEDLGFFDPSTFSRTFRKAFGCTPTDLRLAAQSGERSAPVIRAPQEERRDFASRLRAL
ncbi:helix-turn-helix domain-containing protein [Roseomonas sp. CCTCC AB2023176]|uniref:helix-turn-helix domain-containing protein n=1 Tax=Roseomonas sp. CCTCC AB2023176 TaxID=3342640 RepID=UPI0035D95787